jgi:hypothetical protein
MASKLFHTIVGFGIALGAASLGCSASTDESGATGESALTEPSKEQTPPCAGDGGADSGPDWSAFCDATWPTTKGGTQKFPQCVDPNNECDRAQVFECSESVGEDGACNADKMWTLSVCVNGTWQCKPGRVKTESCTCWIGGDWTDCPATDGGTGIDAGR